VTTSSPAGGSLRSTRRVGLAATLAVIGLTFTFAVMPAAAVTRTPYNTNLVKNPSFEAGSSTGGYRWIAVPNWQTYGNMTVVTYGAPNGFPSLAEGARIAGGTKFFTTGTPPGGDTACHSAAFQVIPIRKRNYAIDAGMVEVTFRLYMGTYDSQSDTAVALLRAQRGSTPQTDLIVFNMTQTDSRMVSQSATARLPYGTRSLTLYLYSKNTQGYCDAYFDRVSVVLNPI
jgi:hypothetical protein